MYYSSWKGSAILKQNRFRSKAAWAVLITSVLTILGYFLDKGTVSIVEGIIMALFLAVEAFGVFNNPENKDGF